MNISFTGLYPIKVQDSADAFLLLHEISNACPRDKKTAFWVENNNNYSMLNLATDDDAHKYSIGAEVIDDIFPYKGITPKEIMKYFQTKLMESVKVFDLTRSNVHKNEDMAKLQDRLGDEGIQINFNSIA